MSTQAGSLAAVSFIRNSLAALYESDNVYEAVDLLKAIYSLLTLNVPDNFNALRDDKTLSSQYLYEFLLDMDDIFMDYEIDD